MVNVSAGSYALLSLTTYQNGWHHLQCFHPSNNIEFSIDACCQQAFADDALDRCGSHAVTLPAVPRVPRVVSFFSLDDSNETNYSSNNNNNNSQSHHRRRIWSDGTWRDADEEDATAPPHQDEEWTAQLVGVGMHRDLQFTWTGGGKEHSDVPFVLYLPAGLFINVEEHGDDAALTILHTAPTIDQEEPVFASIPHGLVILRKGTVPASWTLHLHARYPMPGGESVIVFPVPVEGLQEEQLIVWDVATPSAADTWPVLITSVAIALVGAVVSFRDISRVARWV